MEFTDREFRNALGLFPTGVAIVTTIAPDGTKVGMTVSSFNSVSLSPPLILFSVGRSAKAFNVWGAAETYAVCLLREGQEELASHFARSSNDKWVGLEPMVHNGFLHLPGALAWLDCDSYARHEGGDHLVLIGRVRAITVADEEVHSRPLVFYKGRYRRLETVPA